MISNTALYFIGAAALEVVSIVGIYLVENYRRKCAIDRKLENLERQLADVWKQIEQLQELSRTNNLDSDGSDSEFYEFSEDVTTSTESFDQVNISAPQLPYPSLCPQTLKELDQKLSTPNVESVEEALDRLTELRKDFPKSVEVLWRIGEARQKMASATSDKTAQRGHIDMGVAVCELALELSPNLSDVHKWFAMLVGMRSFLQPLMEKFKDVATYKQHLDIAFALNPNDGFLHYMLGRFSYGIANMKWYERKAASLIFDDPPTGTIEEALEYCLEAERLTNGAIKDNKLAIAECQIALGEYDDAVDTLNKAATCGYDSLDQSVDNEINALLKKYASYT